MTTLEAAISIILIIVYAILVTIRSWDEEQAIERTRLWRKQK